jgi:hypothetical protein
MVSDVRSELFKGLIDSLPDHIEWREMIALIATILKRYGAEKQWPVISVEVSVVLADLDRGSASLN